MLDILSVANTIGSDALVNKCLLFCVDRGVKPKLEDEEKNESDPLLPV